MPSKERCKYKFLFEEDLRPLGGASVDDAGGGGIGLPWLIIYFVDDFGIDCIDSSSCFVGCSMQQQRDSTLSRDNNEEPLNLSHKLMIILFSIAQNLQNHIVTREL